MIRGTGTAKLPVVVVGAGFSGTLLAINLIRLGEPVVLVERDGQQVARGLAYATRQPGHLLNVRAANMGAFPDDPGHFLRWIGQSPDEQANRFVPRRTYGAYLRDLLAEVLAANPGQAEVVEGEALAARFADDAITVSLAGDRSIAARALVLAPGNPPPAMHPALAGVPPPLAFADPWQPGATDGLEAGSHVLLLGSGLTAIDAILSLDAAGFAGRVTVLSRRGLKPRAHLEIGPAVSPAPAPVARGAWLLHALRRRARAVGWRVAVDELRPHTQHLWRRHGEDAQRRFLRHLRPYWDVHRHRLAPAVAARVTELEDAGRLAFVAGKLTGATIEGSGVRVRWRPRGSTHEVEAAVARIINCTGPDGDIARADNPLLVALLSAGCIRPDAHRLGLDVEHTGRVRGADGRPNRRLFAVGPVTKGEAWEIVAVPDIRRQVWDLARYLANAHWVGGEGL